MDDTYRILAEGCFVSNNTRQTALNNNDLVIGVSGGGKTRGYVLPNILLGDESIVVVDTKNTIKSMVSKQLKRKGYDVVSIDFTDLKNSPYGYNPLDYIMFDEETGRYCEQDIMTVSAALTPVTSLREPYWEIMGRVFLESLVSYTLEALPNEEHHLNSVVQLFKVMGNRQKVFDILLTELKQLDPDSFAVSRHEMFKSIAASERTYASILGTLSEKLDVLSFDGAKRLFENPNKLRFEEISKKKTAVFLNISDTDRSMDRLANHFFTQAFHSLCSFADQQPQSTGS